jgi:hypothetical protein
MALAGSLAAFLAGAWLDPAARPPGAPLPGLSAEERAAVGEAIVLSNKILQDFYASGGRHDLLDEIPYSKALRHGVFRDLGALQQAGLVLVLDQADLVPLSLKRTGPDAAEALVFEEWNYLYQRATDRTPVERMRGLGQGFRYWLVRRGAGWGVVRWEPEDVPAPPADAERRW